MCSFVVSDFNMSTGSAPECIKWGGMYNFWGSRAWWGWWFWEESNSLRPSTPHLGLLSVSPSQGSTSSQTKIRAPTPGWVRGLTRGEGAQRPRWLGLYVHLICSETSPWVVHFPVWFSGLCRACDFRIGSFISAEVLKHEVKVTCVGLCVKG